MEFQPVLDPRSLMAEKGAFREELSEALIKAGKGATANKATHLGCSQSSENNSDLHISNICIMF